MWVTGKTEHAASPSRSCNLAVNVSLKRCFHNIVDLRYRYAQFLQVLLVHRHKVKESIPVEFIVLKSLNNILSSVSNETNYLLKLKRVVFFELAHFFNKIFRVLGLIGVNDEESACELVSIKRCYFIIRCIFLKDDATPVDHGCSITA